MAFQALLASVADMWSTVTPCPPPRARERIQTALVRLRARDLDPEGLAVDILDVRGCKACLQCCVHAWVGAIGTGASRWLL